MSWLLALAIVLCWVAVYACWRIREGIYRDRELHARALRRTIPGAGSEPEERMSRAARYARDAFGDSQ